MKNSNYLKVDLTIFVLFFIASSCSTTKKMTLSCPIRSIHYKTVTSLNHPRHNERLSVVSCGDRKRSYSLRKPAFRLNTKQNRPPNTKEGISKDQSSPGSARSGSVIVTNKLVYETNLYAAMVNSGVQSEGAYSMSSVPEEKVSDFGNNETNYASVNINPINAIPGSEINYLRYSEELLSFNTIQVVTLPQEDTIKPKKLNGMALAGFLAGFAGFSLLFSLFVIPQSLPLFIVGLIIGVAGIVLSVKALKKIKENPEKYKGKDLAKVGLASGIVFLILWLGASFLALIVSQIS